MAVAKGDNSKLFLNGKEFSAVSLSRTCSAIEKLQSDMAAIKAEIKHHFDKAKDRGFPKSTVKRAIELRAMTPEERAADLEELITMSIGLGLGERDLLGQIIQLAGSKPPAAPAAEEKDEDDETDSGPESGRRGRKARASEQDKADFD